MGKVKEWTALPNNAMLTRGGWRRVGPSSPARVIVNQGEVVRPPQLIASVRPTKGGVWKDVGVGAWGR
jgi:hypothetical protein